MKNFWTMLVLAVIYIVTQASPLWADNGDMMSMLESIKRQMVQMQETIDRQNLRLQQLESRKIIETTQPEIKVQPAPAALTAMSDADFKKSLKDNVGEVIPFLKGAKQGGDFRLRHEYFDYFNKNTDAGTTDRTRNRFRIRLRYGFEKDFGDDWKAGFRLATGGSTDNVSTNQTLGNRGYFTLKDIFIDKAYAQFTPNGLKSYGAIRGATIGAGKFDNPFTRYATTIVWDSDVTPEGVYEKIDFQLANSENNKLNLYTALGQFLVNENADNETDAQLFGYQGALNWSTRNFGTEQTVDLTFAASYYDYPNFFQTVTSNTASTSYLRTNTSALDNPRILDLYPEIAFTWNGQPVVLWVDHVNNIGSIDPTRVEINEVHGEDTAWGFGFKFGKAKKKGSFEWHYGYFEIGANAVVAAFNDVDFGGPGGVGHTNRQGHKLGLGYRVTENLVMNWTGFFVNPLRPSTVVASSANEDVFRSQVDLNYNF